MGGSTKTRAEWAELLAKFEASGEKISAFSARHRVSPKTLAWWRWRLRNESRELAVHGGVRLVAVDLKAPATTVTRTATPTGAVRISLGDLELCVEVGTDVGYVGALVGALRSRC